MHAGQASHVPEDPLELRMAALGVREEDLEEVFARSGGPGGQNVNKTSTAVQVTHRPTGLTVRCQETRHQGRNRRLARELLLDRIEETRRTAQAEEQARREKKRRQSRPRPAGVKRRILADKNRRSRLKSSRRQRGDD